MTVEVRPDQLQGVNTQPPVPFSLENPTPSQDETDKIIQDLVPKVLDTLDSDPEFSKWAGPDWKTKGLPNVGMHNGRPKDPQVSYFGITPQGGPSFFLAIRRPTGEGILFQIGNPEARTEAGKKSIYLCWDRNGRRTTDRELGEKFIQGLRKIA